MSATSERHQTLSHRVSLYCAASSETIAAWTKKKKEAASPPARHGDRLVTFNHTPTTTTVDVGDSLNRQGWHRRPRLVKIAGVNLKRLLSQEALHLGFWDGGGGGGTPGWHTSVRCHMDVWHHSPLILKGIICSALLYTPTPPFCLPSGISSSESMCCGLALDEQSYYEKSNPSLGDRGVTGFKKTPSDLIPTFLGSQTACSECWSGADTSHAWRQLRSSSQTNVSVFRRREESKLPGGKRTGGRKSSSCPPEYSLFFFTASTVYNSLHVNFDPSILEFYSRK